MIDHAAAPGEKIRISGGGRCNFTNLHAGPDNFLSHNPHFAKSALSRYTQWDFLDLVARHGIPWHEKTLGQLFCDRSAKDIIGMLLSEMRPAELWLRTATADRGVLAIHAGYRGVSGRDISGDPVHGGRQTRRRRRGRGRSGSPGQTSGRLAGR